MVKLQDIADKTGFSLAVVSRALNPRPDQKVAARSAAVIRKAAEELGYRPNQAARLLAKGAGPAIGIFLPQTASVGTLILPLIAGLTETANRFGFACNFYFGLQEEEYLAFLRSVEQERHAGIITYLPSAYTHDAMGSTLDKLRRQNCQVVVVNTPEILTGSRIASTAIDNRLGGRLAARHLLERGVRKFLLLNHPTSWQMHERCRGFAETVLAAGGELTEEDIRHPGAELPRPTFAGHSLWRKMMDSSDVLGVFAGTDYLATALYGELARRGATGRIGREIRLVGFDDQPMAQLLSPALTTVRQPFRMLGEVSMSLLLNRLIDARIPVPETVLKPELVVRESSGEALPAQREKSVLHS